MFGNELLNVTFGRGTGEFIDEFAIDVEPDIRNAAHGLLGGQLFFRIHIDHTELDGSGVFLGN